MANRTGTIRVAPSMLSADFSALGADLAAVEEAGADVIHIDVMDGHFVPNITIGPLVVRALRPLTKLPLDCHLMISEPQRYIGAFLEAGADMISVHVEVEPHLQRALAMIRAGGAKAGIAINPATSADTLAEALPYCDYVLAMTVNPGFGGQKFLPPSVEKVRRIDRMIRDRNLDVAIEVDGGIDRDTAPAIVGAGAEILVAGTAVFGHPDRRAAIELLKRRG
ncbi:MAG: ribulose-phosphate 3-epimerase [Thermoanaerobaculia bacterium]|nr:ribulose-phosphate 3-epimerase [Thermoanaerobaculia bacterium]